jgi:hypothetical protein
MGMSAAQLFEDIEVTDTMDDALEPSHPRDAVASGFMAPAGKELGPVHGRR